MALLKSLPFLFLAWTLTLPAETPPDAETGWSKLQGANPLPHLPGEWKTTPPADQELIRQTLRAETERLLALAERARKFAANFPADRRRAAAVQLAQQALQSAEKLGSPAARTQLAEFDRERLADPQLPAEQRLEIRMRQVQTAAEALTQTSAIEARDKYEAGARELTKEFPGQAAPWAMLLEVIDQGNDSDTRTKLTEIVNSAAPAPIKERATGILHRYDMLGKPLTLKFTALDGREVDLAKLRGKVVVIHFWASWCTTCLEGMATIAKAYNTLRELGVEVIGIDLDSDKAKVEQAVREKNLTWPQFYEPAGRANRIVREFGVTTLPAMWLVDGKGLLRDLNAQDDLSKKIQKILEESAVAQP